MADQRSAVSRSAGKLWRSLQRGPARRQHYRITIEGWFFLAGMALIGFASWHSGTNLLYLIFATMISFFLAHGFLVWASLLGLDVRRSFPATIRAGEAVTIDLTVSNDRMLSASYGLRLTDRRADGTLLGSAFLFRAPRRGSGVTGYSVTFPLRGVYAVERVTVASRFPFGMVERSFHVSRPDEIVVLPQVAGLDALSTELPLQEGFDESERRGGGADLYGVRPYVPGEHARRIHWRSTARALRLMLMEFEREEQRKVTLVLRNVASPEDAARPEVRRDFELAVIVVASLADTFCRRGQDVALVTSSGTLTPDTGHEHLLRIHTALARLALAASARQWPMEQIDSSSLLEVRYRDWYSGEGPIADVEFEARDLILRGNELHEATPGAATTPQLLPSASPEAGAA